MVNTSRPNGLKPYRKNGKSLSDGVLGDEDWEWFYGSRYILRLQTVWPVIHPRYKGVHNSA